MQQFTDNDLAVYLRKLKVREREAVGGQFTAFLTALFKAVEGSPNTVVVYTLAIGKATDAYTDENQFIADNLDSCRCRPSTQWPRPRSPHA